MAHALSFDLPRYRLTVDEYHRMIESGAFDEDQRIELLGGELIEMTPIGPRHVNQVRHLINILRKRLPDEILLDVQNPVTLNDDSEPQPDLILLKRRRYGKALPNPADLHLIIEVSDSSLSYDRSAKLAFYAASGVPEVWIFDMVAGALEIYREPSGTSFSIAERPTPDQTITIPGAPGLTLRVRDLFSED